MTEQKYPGRYLSDDDLNSLIETCGNDLSYRASMARKYTLEGPREDEQRNRQQMIDAATMYVGLRMLKEERRDVRLFYSDTFGSGTPDGFCDE